MKYQSQSVPYMTFSEQIKYDTCPKFKNTLFKLEKENQKITNVKGSVINHWKEAREQLCTFCYNHLCDNYMVE